MLRLNETLGSLWFSTTITFSPLGSVKASGFLILITGDGPDFGCVRSCACIIKVKNKLDKMIIDFFMI